MEVALHVGQTDTDDGVVEEGQEEDGAQGRQSERLGGGAEPTFLHGQAGRRPVDRQGAAGHPAPLGQHRAPPGRDRTEAGSMVWFTHWSFAYPKGG